MFLFSFNSEHAAGSVCWIAWSFSSPNHVT